MQGTRRLENLREEVSAIAREIAAPLASEIDRDARWPAEAMQALATAGLTGLTVPSRLGGRGEGLTALAIATEELGRFCASTALCFGMHCVGAAVLAAKPTKYQEEQFLAPIAQGQHITTLALSETGSGAHFYLPQTRLTRVGDDYAIHGTKQFVTNGSHADSYVISTVARDASETGEFSCLLVENDREGVVWLDPWHGLGMRGNSSRGMKLDGVHVPVDNLLGESGDQIWYAFEVIAPYFLMAMAGTYIGIAQAALDYTIHHVRSRVWTSTGGRLSESESVQQKIAELWAMVEKTRLLIHDAATAGDIGDESALTAILTSKAEVADAVVHVVNEAMTICGGIAYRENDELARLLRDARAAHVMTPTTALLRTWAGRSLLGLRLL